MEAKICYTAVQKGRGGGGRQEEGSVKFREGLLEPNFI